MTNIGIIRKVDSLGRVTLPKEMRRLFRLEKNDWVEMNEFLHVGFDAFINVAKIRLIAPIDADKLRREMKRREIDKGSVLFWNTAAGKETKSVILLDDGMLVASGVSSETLVKRFNEIVRGGTKE